MDTLEQVLFDSEKYETYTLPKIENVYKNIKESKIKRSNNGLFGSKINYTSIKCIEKIINLKLDDNIISLRLAKDRENILYRNSITIIKCDNLDINKMYGALIRNEIIEVDF
jgi:hypothetical protein